MTDVVDTYLPFSTDANDQASGSPMFSFTPFAYVGQALTLAEFATYVEGYDFGSIPPDYLILHHTAIPATHAAPYGDPKRHWDAGEAGLSRAQIKTKRLSQLHAIMRYYRDTLGWSAGPHLFIDDLFIYLFTPMNTVGIHAREGNSYRADNRLHYSIGVEVVGYYERVQWPPSVERNVSTAVALLQRTLKTFDITYSRFAGGISSHRDYNKPECPGHAITSNYYISTIQAAAVELAADDDLTFVAPPRISRDVFTRVLVEAASPAAPDAHNLYAIPLQYSLDPAIALAFFEHESRYGRVGICREFDCRNWGMVRTPYDPMLSIGSTDHPFAKYATWHDGLDDWCKRILYRYIGLWQLDTVRKALPKYAPKTDRNDPKVYADAVIASVKRWSALILPDAPSLPRLSLYRVSGKGGARVFAKPHTAATKVRVVKPGVEVAGTLVEGQLYRGVKSWLHLADDSGYMWRGSLAEVP